MCLVEWIENPFIPGAAEGSYYARLAAAATVACRWLYRCPMMAASQGDDGGSAFCVISPFGYPFFDVLWD